ncbi:MAG: glycosyltransferase family 2 protein [Planctomycetota bacterium]
MTESTVKVYLEYPFAGCYHLAGSLEVRGWAFASHEITRADVLIDGEVVAPLERGDQRPDVVRAHAPRPGSAWSVSVSLDLEQWRGKTLQLSLRCADRLGAVKETVPVVVSVAARGDRPRLIEFLRGRFRTLRRVPRSRGEAAGWWEAWRSGLGEYRRVRRVGRHERPRPPTRLVPAEERELLVADALAREQLRERLSLQRRAPTVTLVVYAAQIDEVALTRSLRSASALVYDAVDVVIAVPDVLRDRALATLAAVRPAVPTKVVSAPGLREAFGTAIHVTSGEFVGWLGSGDVLDEGALVVLAEVLQQADSVDWVYSDEDRLVGGKLREPFLKPDWSAELLFAQPYALHLALLRRELVERCLVPDGGDGAVVYDLALRAAECAPSVRHVPAVLIHRVPAAPADLAAAVRVVRAALRRANLRGRVSPRPHWGGQWVELEPVADPAVTIVIPTRDRIEMLRRCVRSVLRRTRYPNWSILIVDNDSRDPETLAQLETWRQHPKIAVRHDPRPFNYAALNNAAVAACGTPLVLLLNNDTEVIASGWLTGMVAWLYRPGVGAVGARLYYGDDTVQHAGLTLGVGGVASHGHKRFARGDPGYFGLIESAREVSAVTAACLLLRSSTYQEVGGLDEALAVAYNDVDLCLRLRSRGWRILYAPQAELWHYESISRGRDRGDRFARERALMLERWGDSLRHDPFYHPRLSRTSVDYRVAE